MALTALLVALPLLSLALNAFGWLRHGIDLPFYDDWRGYDSWDIDSLDLIYLVRPLNDTLTPVGLALDALAQRLLDGHSIAYQLLSMLAVLGSLLFLQWKMLRAVLGDPLHAALCFVFTLLMLQPASYWGRENLAYQQALPLVFILTALWLGLVRPARAAWALPAVAALGVLAGFTYISGAFGAVAAGLGVVCAALLPAMRAVRGRVLPAGAALALGGLLAAAAQFVLVILPQGRGTSVAGKALGLPTQGDFWLFYLGKLGRSLMLPDHAPWLALLLVLAACALVVAVAVLAVRRLHRVPDWAGGPAFVPLYAGLAALVFAYLMMVAAGRLNFRPAGVQAPLEIFAFGFQRFHFFWATLLWPWVVAGLILLAQRPGAPVPGPVARRLGLAAVAMGTAGMVAAGALGHVATYQRAAADRRPAISCLVDKLQRGGRIECEEFNLPDLTPAYVYARHIGASFVRYFPVLPIELGVDSPAPLFRLGRDAGRPPGPAPAAAEPAPGADSPLRPRHVIDLGAEARDCAMLDVRGRARSAGADRVTVFFKPWGQRDFHADSSMTRPVTPASGHFLFRIEHPIGFENGLGIQGGSPQVELEALEVRCRLRLRKHLIHPFHGVRDSKMPLRLERMERLADGPGRFRVGDRPHATFRTGRGYEMATCRTLEAVVIFQVEKEDIVQLYYRPRGSGGFVELHSVAQTVSPRSGMHHVALIAESPSGFADELRLDPVRKAQVVQFYDVELRCLRRTLRPRRGLPEMP